MKRPGHEVTNFFVGTEIEHSPTHGMLTLFVVGLQPVSKIQDILDRSSEHVDSARHIRHIYFGANHSFPKLAYDSAEAWRGWEHMIMAFLDRGYWCTLDLDVSCISGLTDGALCEQEKFVPMISVKMPYLQQLGYNATVKLDDVDFSATNPGVWCHSLHDLMDRSKFTRWEQYQNDEVLK